MAYNNLLEYIEIKDFKCFKDFKAEGFKRVNLIGGKNNVGKTAFMEACYVNVNSKNINQFTYSLGSIVFKRDKKNKINVSIKLDTKQMIESLDGIFSNSNINKTLFKIIEKDGIKKYNIILKDKEINVNVNEFSFSLENVGNINFIDSVGYSYKTIKENYTALQRIDKENYLNEILKTFDSNIEAFKIIDDKAQCKVNGIYLESVKLGDGVSHLVSIVSSLYNSKNGYLFIDEIENGFHYTFLDKLWEIIFTISKEQNVQVFITTHSKECIESFNRVQLKLEEDDTIYLELARNIKTKELFMSSIDKEQLRYELTHDGRFRGE